MITAKTNNPHNIHRLLLSNDQALIAHSPQPNHMPTLKSLTSPYAVYNDLQHTTVPSKIREYKERLDRN